MCASRHHARLQAIKGVSSAPGEGMCIGCGSDAVQTLSVLFQEESQDTCKGKYSCWTVIPDHSSGDWLVYFGLAFSTEPVPEHG